MGTASTIELYDYHLRNALLRLRDMEDSQKSVVTACLFTPPDKSVYSISSLHESGTWNHAERNALTSYIRTHGLPVQDSVMITSLSPCKKDSPHRYGVSCTDMLLGNDPEHKGIAIQRLHVGFIDPWQPTLEDYLSLGFEITVSQDEKIHEACRRLFNYFLPENYNKAEKGRFVADALNDL
jgi:pyrimidine deaminase RibD-like protein